MEALSGRNDAYASTLEVIRRIVSRVSSPLRVFFAGAFALALFVSFAQLVMVGCVALLGAAIASPEGVAGSERIGLLAEFIPMIDWQDSNVLLVTVSLLSIVAVLVTNCIRLLHIYVTSWLSYKVGKEVGSILLSRFLDLPYQWVMNKNSADLHQVVAFSQHYGTVVLGLLRGGCELITGIILITGVVIELSSAAIIGALVLATLVVLLYKISKRKIDRLGQRMARAQFIRNRAVLSAFQGINEVKFFGREKMLVDVYEDESQKLVQYVSRQTLPMSAPTLFLESFGFVAVCGFIVYMISTGATTAYLAGMASLLVAVAWRIFPCLNSLLGAMNRIRASWPFVEQCERCFDEFEGYDFAALAAQRGNPSTVEWAVYELKGLEFSYGSDQKAVLQGIDMTIAKGMAVGVVGPSGAGKSTLVNLVCGMYAPSKGGLFLDGWRVDSPENKGLRIPSIGYVLQDPYIMDGSIAENVAFSFSGNGFDRERILKCCEMACMDYLKELPEGIDTRIGEKGVRLSGGQKQRISIARALFSDPDIIVLDEATSSLDTKSERAVLEAIYGLKGEVTLVMIAHRLTTVKKCDVVYWIDEGQVRMVGTPDEVIPAYTEYMDSISDFGQK